MLREFCSENFTNIASAIANGASRIELCDNLAVGGTTPSIGVITASVALGKRHGVPIMVIIRPRGGNFVFTPQEVDMMLMDLQEAKRLGAHGVVVGCLTAEHRIDERAMELLINAAKGLSITFHMAFDDIPAEHQRATIDWLAAHGVDRILTHGGPAQRSIEENADHLLSLCRYAAGRIGILPGGGVSYENAERIAKLLGVTEVHGTRIVNIHKSSL